MPLTLRAICLVSNKNKKLVSTPYIQSRNLIDQSEIDPKSSSCRYILAEKLLEKLHTQYPEINQDTSEEVLSETMISVDIQDFICPWSQILIVHAGITTQGEVCQIDEHPTYGSNHSEVQINDHLSSLSQHLIAQFRQALFENTIEILLPDSTHREFMLKTYDDEDHSHLHWVVTCNDKSFAERAALIDKLLTNYGFKIDDRDHEYDNTPLMVIADYSIDDKDAIEIARYLVSKGADLLAENRNVETPLVCAALYGSVEMLEYLVQCHIDAKISHGTLHSVLMHTLHLTLTDDESSLDFHNFKHLFERAKKHDCDWDINKRDLPEEGLTLLMLQAQKECACNEKTMCDTCEIIRILIDNEADPLLCDDKGNTTLHYFAEKNNTQGLTLALNKLPPRPAFDLRNNEGQTPRDIAMKSGNIRCVNIFTRFSDEYWRQEKNQHETTQKTFVLMQKIYNMFTASIKTTAASPIPTIQLSHHAKSPFVPSSLAKQLEKKQKCNGTSTRSESTPLTCPEEKDRSLKRLRR